MPSTNKRLDSSASFSMHPANPMSCNRLESGPNYPLFSLPGSTIRDNERRHVSIREQRLDTPMRLALYKQCHGISKGIRRRARHHQPQSDSDAEEVSDAHSPPSPGAGAELPDSGSSKEDCKSERQRERSRVAAQLRRSMESQALARVQTALPAPTTTALLLEKSGVIRIAGHALFLFNCLAQALGVTDEASIHLHSESLLGLLIDSQLQIAYATPGLANLIGQHWWNLIGLPLNELIELSEESAPKTGDLVRIPITPTSPTSSAPVATSPLPQTCSSVRTGRIAASGNGATLPQHLSTATSNGNTLLCLCWSSVLVRVACCPLRHCLLQPINPPPTPTPSRSPSISEVAQHPDDVRHRQDQPTNQRQLTHAQISLLESESYAGLVEPPREEQLTTVFRTYHDRTLLICEADSNADRCLRPSNLPSSPSSISGAACGSISGIDSNIRSQLIGHNWLDLIHPNDVAGVKVTLDKVMLCCGRTRVAWTGLYRLRAVMASSDVGTGQDDCLPPGECYMWVRSLLCRTDQRYPLVCRHQVAGMDNAVHSKTLRPPRNLHSDHHRARQEDEPDPAEEMQSFPSSYDPSCSWACPSPDDPAFTLSPSLPPTSGQDHDPILYELTLNGAELPCSPAPTSPASGKVAGRSGGRKHVRLWTDGRPDTQRRSKRRMCQSYIESRSCSSPISVGSNFFEDCTSVLSATVAGSMDDYDEVTTCDDALTPPLFPTRHDPLLPSIASTSSSSAIDQLDACSVVNQSDACSPYLNDEDISLWFQTDSSNWLPTDLTEEDSFLLMT